VVTVKDINNKRFEPVKNGYNTMEVDEFLKQCSNALKVSQSENEDLRQKLTILADSIRDYQKKEADIAGAFLDIQRTKRFALEDAQNEARKIINDAHDQAKAILGNTSSKLHSEAAAYERLKKEVALFKENVLAMYKEHLSIFTAIPDEYEEDEIEETEPVSTQSTEETPTASGGIFSDAAESFAEPVYEDNYSEGAAAEISQDTSDNTADDQSDLYEQAFGAKPVPGKTDKLDGLRFGQNV
jgi:cell division initiation protein